MAQRAVSGGQHPVVCSRLPPVDTGRWFDFSLAGYRQDLATPLGEALLAPLSVISHPWLMAVMGLLLGGIIFTPVITAVLYPLAVSMVFALMTAVLGHAPVLAVATVAGCIVAAKTPLRNDMPFYAVVVGTAPAALYLWLFSYSDSQAVAFLPLQLWALAGPFLMAVFAAILAGAAVLGLTRVTRFRAGVIWPVLLVLVAAAGTIFYVEVGPDELDYALITNDLAAGDLVFRPVGLKQWTRTHQAEGLNDQSLRNRLDDDLSQRQDRLISQCETFLNRYPSSSRAPEVLWLEAQCKSLQLDVPGLKDKTVRYSACFPLPESSSLWRRLVDEFPDSSQAALADWKLGDLALRADDPAAGDRYLTSAIDALRRVEVSLRQAGRAGPGSGVFRKPRTIPSPGYYADALFQTRRLAWLIDVNHVMTDPLAAKALGAMLNESPNEPRLDERLGKLASIYEATSLGDNLKLAVAMATTDPYMQAEMLIWLAEDQRTDAAIEANYQLGMLVMQTARARALTLIPKIKTAEEYSRIVVAAPPNPWQPFAREHLARLTDSRRRP